MRSKDIDKACACACTSELPSLDGFSLEADDQLRISRRVGDGVWKEYSVSFGELYRAVGRNLHLRRPLGA